MKLLILLLSCASLTLMADSKKTYDLSNIHTLAEKDVYDIIPEKCSSYLTPYHNREYWQKYSGCKTEEELAKYILRVQAFLNKLTKNGKWVPDFINGAPSLAGNIVNLRKAARPLYCLTVLECLKNDGKQVPQIIQIIEAMLKVDCWIPPAHGALKNKKENYKSFEHASAQVMQAVAFVFYILDDKLPTELRERFVKHVKTWMVNPYLERVKQLEETGRFDGRGFWWFNGVTNQNVMDHYLMLSTISKVIPDRSIRAKIIHSSLHQIPKYLNMYKDDAYCVEGTSYWETGFGNYIKCAEEILFITNKRINLYKGSEKLNSIARFLLNSEIKSDFYPSFGDGGGSPRRPQKYPYMTSILYARCGFDEYRNDYIKHIMNPKIYLSRLIHRGRQLNIAENSNLRPQVSQPEHRLFHYFDKEGVVISRGKNCSDNQLSLAVKAGNNGWPHGHMDTGSFGIWVNTSQVICDPGCPVYYLVRNSKLVKEKKYDKNIDAANSFGHPVPVVNGKYQDYGKKFYGKITKCILNDKQSTIVIDLKHAYPTDCGIKSLIRTFIHDRTTNTITLTDEVELEKPGTFGSALLTYGSIAKSDENYVFKEQGKELKVSFDAKRDEGGFWNQFTGLFSSNVTLKFSQQKLQWPMVQAHPGIPNNTLFGPVNVDKQPTRFYYEFSKLSKKFKITTKFSVANNGN